MENDYEHNNTNMGIGQYNLLYLTNKYKKWKNMGFRTDGTSFLCNIELSSV